MLDTFDAGSRKERVYECQVRGDTGTRSELTRMRTRARHVRDETEAAAACRRRSSAWRPRWRTRSRARTRRRRARARTWLAASNLQLRGTRRRWRRSVDRRSRVEGRGPRTVSQSAIVGLDFRTVRSRAPPRPSGKTCTEVCGEGSRARAGGLRQGLRARARAKPGMQSGEHRREVERRVGHS